MAALAIIHKQQICERLAKGEQLVHIAQSLGCTPGAISQQLSKDEDYLAAREDQLDCRMVQRENELELASDMLNLARARDLLSHARWRAERECPARWGKESAPSATSDVLNTVSAALLTRVANLLPPAPRVIEHEGGGDASLSEIDPPV